MKIGVIGAGRIGGNCARQAVKAGHEVMLSFARDQSTLDEIASVSAEAVRPRGPAATEASPPRVNLSDIT